MSRRYTTEEFIAKAKAVHGNKYDYSSHLKVAGCPKCAGRNLTQEEAIEQFRKVHGDLSRRTAFHRIWFYGRRGEASCASATRLPQIRTLYPNLGIDYPYFVIEDKSVLLEAKMQASAVISLQPAFQILMKEKEKGD